MSGLNFYQLFEFFGFLSFALIGVREIYERHFWRFFEFVSCALFGVVLEIGNVYLGRTYTYSPDFIVNLANVPIVIGLGWAVIIYCAMRLSDQYNAPWILRPFMDALIAVSLDLGMDAVAIRLGLWRWTIPLDREWYGVPYENFVGWILVVLCFSFLIRYLRTLDYHRLSTKLLLIISPIIAYLALIIGLTLFGLLAILPTQNLNWLRMELFQSAQNFNLLLNPQVEFKKAVILVVLLVSLCTTVIWSMIKYRRNVSVSFDLLTSVILTGIHIFFILAIFSTGLYLQMPILLIVALVGLLLHVFLQAYPYFLSREHG